MEKKFNRVKYIDSNSHKTFHDQYNASFLATCCYAFDNVEYIVGKSSYKNTKKLLDNLTGFKFKLKYIWVLGGDNRIALLFRTILGALQNIRFLVFSSKADLLIYNCNNFIFLYFANVLTKLFDREVIIVCHSELAFIEMDCFHHNLVYNYRTNILRYIYKNTRVKIAEKLRFCVMGESILLNLEKHINQEKMNHFFSVDHPYIFVNNIKSTQKKLEACSRIKIGVIGTMALEKGADILISIAKNLNLKDRKDISLEIIGKILCDTKQFEEFGIILPPNNGKEPLHRALFNKMVEELDFILYLYPVNSYKFTASGSLLDAINFEKPILSFKNDYFCYFFEKHGNFGYLLENEKQMVEQIKNLANNNPKDLKKTFNIIKKKLSPNTIQNELTKEVSIGKI